jgi:hypothetical protein
MAQPKSNRQLAQAYAANFRDETSYGMFGNMSYRGRLAYSWSTVIINQHDDICFEHSKTWSNSTASQRSEYFMALRNVGVDTACIAIPVPQDPANSANYEYLVECAKQALLDVSKPRIRELTKFGLIANAKMYLKQYEQLVQHTNNNIAHVYRDAQKLRDALSHDENLVVLQSLMALNFGVQS